ncbi:unnamed protein product [Caretta caretta]
MEKIKYELFKSKLGIQVTIQPFKSNSFNLPTAKLPVQYKGWSGKWTFAVYDDYPIPMLLGEDLANHVKQAKRVGMSEGPSLDESLQRAWTAARSNPPPLSSSNRSRFVIERGLLYKETLPGGHQEDWHPQRQLVVPTKYRAKLLSLAHDHPSGHARVNRTKDRLGGSFRWEGMGKDVSTYVQSCEVCQRVGKPQDQVKAPLQPLPIIEVPFQRVAVDILGPFLKKTPRGKHVTNILDFKGPDQEFHPVVFLSKKLSERESNWSVTEKECYAIVYALEKLRPYVWGRRFHLQTDHVALKWLHTVKETNKKLLRWSLALQDFDFNIQHISGASNKVADALSRESFPESTG